MVIHHTIAQTPPKTRQDDSFINFLLSPEMVLVFLLLALAGGMKLLEGKGKKSKLATARWGGEIEKRKALRMGLKLIRDRKYNRVALYLDRPARRLRLKKSAANSKNPLFLNEVERGTVIIGGPGTGKTISGFLPLIFAAIDQGLPILLYDFKYWDLAQQAIGFAAKQGYDVRILAPGYPESEVCNLLDFLDPKKLATMAAQFAEVLNRNFNKDQQKGGDIFFQQAGDQLVAGILMLAKETAYPDLLMCQALLSLKDLPKRLHYNRRKMSSTTYQTFATVMAAASSEKTVAGIVAMAAKNFTTFVKPELLSALVGQSTLPITLKGKQMVILGLDQENRDVISPIIATLLDLAIARNVSFRREDPLMLFLDEAPTLYLPRLTNWLNEFRSKGLCTVLGCQNKVQMELLYGKERAEAIFGACAAKLIYNPQTPESAEWVAKFLGQTEIVLKQKSRSTGGGKGGSSTSYSDHHQARDLLPSYELLKFDAGERIIISPGFKSRGEAYVPIRDKVPIEPNMVVSPLFTQTLNESTALWDRLKEKLIDRSPQREFNDEDIALRERAAKAFLGIPDDEEAKEDLQQEMKQDYGWKSDGEDTNPHFDFGKVNFNKFKDLM